MAEKELKPTIDIEQEGEVVFSPTSSIEDIAPEVGVPVASIPEDEIVKEEVEPVVQDNNPSPKISYGYLPEFKDGDNSNSPSKIVSEKSLGLPIKE